MNHAALLSLTPLAAFRARAVSTPHAVALVDFDGSKWTRARLLAECDGACHGLRAAGFAAGDRVLFSVRPGARAVVLALAVHELGGVLVPQDPGVGDELFLARVAKLAPKWVMAEAVLLLRAGALATRVLGWAGQRFAPLGELSGARFVRVGRAWLGAAPSTAYEDLVATAGAPHTQTVDENAEALLVHTSGTTASPRVVVHTRRSLAAILDAVARELILNEGDVLFARDLHLLLPALAAGATAVVPPARAFSAKHVLERITSTGATHAFMVTRDCRLLLEYCESTQRRLPTHLRMLMIGAAPVRADFLARLRGVLSPECVAWCVFGATEALPIARISLEEKVSWQGEGDLVGAVIEGMHAQIREDGQLVVAGARLCRGYLGEPDFHECATGDIARLDDGRIVLMGRAKDMIIRGEHNIYPELFEPTIERIPGVRRAALVGDFDSALADERVILVIEPHADVAADVLKRRVQSALETGPQRIDRAALPDRIEVCTIPEAGRSGKVDKQALRASLGARSPVR